jgi:hypothetical protein
MGDEQELTRAEIGALADAFSRPESARTLLQSAHFPRWAIPVTGFANFRDFWALVAEQVADGVRQGARRDILAAASELLPGNGKFAAFVAAIDQAVSPPGPQAAAPVPPPLAGPLGPVTVTGSEGVQIGENSFQVNVFTAPPSRAPGDTGGGEVQGDSRARGLRVLVIGASPADQGLSFVRSDWEGSAIKKLAAAGRLAVELVLAAKVTDLRHVGSFRPDILHLVCHGDGDSLAFNDVRGEADYVPAARAAEMLAFYRAEHGVRLRGIVLAACDGEFLVPHFSGVADTVIAHRGKLPDPCGLAFAEQFYTLLDEAAARPGGDGATASLAAAAREAAQLTAGHAELCASVIANLITVTGGG